MFDRKELKAQAKLRMKESEPRYWKVMLIWFAAAMLVPTVILGLVSTPFDQLTVMIASGIDPGMALSLVGGSAAVGMVLSIVLSLYQMVMTFGLTNYSLKLWRGSECGWRTLFEGFGYTWRVIGSQLLVGLFSVLWALLLMIPYAVIIAVGVMMDNGLGIFLVVLGYIAFLVGLVVIVLRYSLTTLALADHPELGALSAIRRSKELMKGHKGQYFVLSLSFIGWILLSSLLVIVLSALAGAGVLSGTGILFSLLTAVATLPMYLWLEPYMQLSFAGFYDALNAEQQPEVEPLNEYPQF